MEENLFDPLPLPSRNTVGKDDRAVVRLEKPERTQVEMNLSSLEERIPWDHPVRNVWDFVERLDLSKMHKEFRSVLGGPGRSVKDRRILLALWLYAYSEGIGSARRIDALCRRDDVYRWLAGGVSLNYHTIADFRTEGDVLEDLLAQSLAVMMKENLIDPTRLAADGTKIRARAKGSRFHKEPTLQELLAAARGHLEEVNKQTDENIDMDARVRAARQRHAREKVEKCTKALETFEKLRTEKKSRKRKPALIRASVTDSDARIMKFGGSSAFHPAYNVQIASTLDTNVIVAIEPTQEHCDARGLQVIVPASRKNTGTKPDLAVTDSGFLNLTTLEYMENCKIEFYAQEIKPPASQESKPNFCRDNSTWDPDAKTMKCPAGHTFALGSDKRIEADPPCFRFERREKFCGGCSMDHRCFPNAQKNRRNTVQFRDRRKMNALRRRHHERIETPQAKGLLKMRCRHELVNAKVKDQFHLSQFHLAGTEKVRAEAILTAICHNRMRWSALIAARNA
jgi:transposase